MPRNGFCINFLNEINRATKEAKVTLSGSICGVSVNDLKLAFFKQMEREKGNR